jgi:hypothetical protein
MIHHRLQQKKVTNLAHCAQLSSLNWYHYHHHQPMLQGWFTSFSHPIGGTGTLHKGFDNEQMSGEK